MGKLEPLISRMSYDELIERAGSTGDSMSVISCDGKRIFISYDGTDLTIDGKHAELNQIPVNVKRIIIENSPGQESLQVLRR